MAPPSYRQKPDEGSERVVRVADQNVSLMPLTRRLDPFGFFPGMASQIRPFGGTDRDPNRRYAFHTPYVAAGGRKIRFDLHICGIAARSGILHVAIHALSSAGSAHAREIESRRIRLADCGAELVTHIDTDAFADSTYALIGHLSDASEIEASDLNIDLRSSGDLSVDPPLLGNYVPCGPEAALFAGHRPSLETPVSQMCTASQFDEPSYAYWLTRMGTPLQRHRKQWEFVYILQALEQFGALQRGARGLGFGVGREPLPALFASIGVDVMATDLPADHNDVSLWHDTSQHISTIDSLLRPGICSAEQLAAHVCFRPVDMTNVPIDLVGFDFTWSSCAFEHLGSIEAGLEFVERSIACLRPGGIAVHTTELNLSSDSDTIDHASTVLFRRRDITRLALRLIAAGHHVAPLNFDSGETPLDRHIDLPPYESDPHLKIAFGNYATTSFGLAVRRGNLGDLDTAHSFMPSALSQAE